MLTLNLINTVLNHIGEQSIATSAGTIGSLTRTAIQTSMTKVAQETRAVFFEQLYTMTATNDDYLVPVGQLSTQIIQLYTVSFKNGSQLVKLSEQPLAQLDELLGYSILGSSLYLTPMLARPASLYIHALVNPVLPTADDVDAGIPDVLLPAVIHQAASILLVTYVDDANAAAIQQRLSDNLITIARNQTGVSRGRQFNMGGVN